MLWTASWKDWDDRGKEEKDQALLFLKMVQNCQECKEQSQGGKRNQRGTHSIFPPLGKCPKPDPRRGMKEQPGHQDGLAKIWEEFVFLSKPGDV